MLNLEVYYMSLSKQIKNRIDDYIEFDCNEIFECGNLIRIFGGSVRDSICGDPINDIDILCGTESMNKIEHLLSSKGYYKIDALTPVDLSSIYKDVRVINEPHSWVMKNKVIQLIRPSAGQRNISAKQYEEVFKRLISNVDLSCCGVSFDGFNLYENYPGSVSHCLNKIYIENRDATMYNPMRISVRKQKMLLRDWKCVNQNDKSQLRDMKISELLDENDFIKEYITIGNKKTTSDDLNLFFDI
jgi:hypothetical protein